MAADKIPRTWPPVENNKIVPLWQGGTRPNFQTEQERKRHVYVTHNTYLKFTHFVLVWLTLNINQDSRQYEPSSSKRERRCY